MQYSVVLVPFPFDDLTGSKVRPAVCLTDAVGAYRHVVLAFITSAVPPMPEATDIVIDPSTSDFGPTGLRVRSAIRLHRMVTVFASLIRARLGVLTPALQAQTQTRLRGLFQL